MRGEVPLAALMQEWLAEDNGPDDPDIEQQMRDLDAARHSTQSLFRQEPPMPLSDLAAALAAATGPSRELDERMAVEVFGSVPLGGRNISMNTKRLYTSDLRAIWSAIDERWRPMRVGVSRGKGSPSEATIVDGGARCYDGKGPCGDDGSIALCLAAVRLALAEEGR